MKPLRSLALLFLSLVAIGALAPDAQARDPRGDEPGAILIFPFFTTGSRGSHDTEITIANASDQPAIARVIIVRRGLDRFSSVLQLNAFQSSSFSPKKFGIMSEGWILAVQVDADNNPVERNDLLGVAMVKGPGIPMGALPAVALQAMGGNNFDATLALDDSEYESAPSFLIAPRIASPEDDNRPTLIIDRIDGTLEGPPVRPFSLDVLLENELLAFFGFGLLGDNQATYDLSDLDFDLGVVFPSRTTGQARVQEFEPGFVVGVLVQRNPDAPGADGAFEGIENLAWQGKRQDFTEIVLPP